MARALTEPQLRASSRAEPAYAAVAERLRARILEGDLVPGERLPNEAELSAQLGVSRSTVREALRVLSSQGLVTTARGVAGGSFVAHPAPRAISDALEASLGLLAGSASVSVPDLLEARELLEVPAARLAAQRRDDADLDILEATLVRGRTAGPSGRFERHRTFHAALLDASGNRLLEILTRPVFTVLATRFHREDAPASFWREVERDHVAIADAVSSADADAAGELMRAHLLRLRATYERIDRATRAGAA